MYYTNLFWGWLHARTAYAFSHLFGIIVFVSLFAYNMFEDLNEYKIYKMIEKIQLELICIIEHISFFILV